MLARFNIRSHQIRALVGGFTVMLVQGSMYVYGTLTPYIVTYLHYQGYYDLKISSLSIIMTIAIICTNLGIFLSQFKIVSFSNRITALISGLGIALSVFLLSFAKSVAVYILLYGVMFGICIGYGYMAPLKNCYEHLPNRKGLCSGTCLMGFGLGAFFFNFIVVDLINPNNQKQVDHLFPQQVGDNLPPALMIMSAIYAAIGLVGAFLITPNQQQTTSLLSKNESLTPEASITTQTTQVISHASIKAFKLAHSKKLFLLMAILALSVPFGIFVAFNYKEYGLNYINDDKFLSLIGSLGSICNGVSRFVWGNLMDYLSYRIICVSMCFIALCSCVSLIWSVHNQYLYMISVLASYFVYGGLFSIYPTQTVRLLGKILGPRLYYMTFMGFSIGVVIQYLAHILIIQQVGVDGFEYCFILFGVSLTISTIIALIVNFQNESAEQSLLNKDRRIAQSIPIQQ